MSDKSKQSVIPQKSLEDLTKKHGNNFCADCSAPGNFFNLLVRNLFNCCNITQFDRYNKFEII